MIPEGEADKLVVYLMHFDRELRGRQHYIGSTIYARRFTRWHEHQLGNGSGYTRRFIRAHIGFKVVRLWFCSTRMHEQVLKRTAKFSSLCPICTPSIGAWLPLHFDARPWSPEISAHWSNRKGGPP